jgi:hypothetical protein
MAPYRGKPVAVNLFRFLVHRVLSRMACLRQEAIALKGKVIVIAGDLLEAGQEFLPNLFGWPARFAALARDVRPNGGGLHAALGGGNTMPLTAFCGADGGLPAAESAALVPVGSLKAKSPSCSACHQLRGRRS